MSVKLFVGGLAWKTSKETLAQAAEAVTTIENVFVATDRETGRSRGFGFITVHNQEAANNLIAALDGKELEGRNIKVQVAAEREPRESTPRQGGSSGSFNRGGNFGRPSGRGPSNW